jgi:thioesterase domain-containing protein
MGAEITVKMSANSPPMASASLESRVPGAEEDVFVFPASIAQEGFWLLDQLEPGNPAYNIAVRFRLQGALDVAVLERALNEIVRRHEVLRTTFDAVDGEPMQVVRPSMRVAIPVLDIRILDDRERDAEEERLTLEEARRRFDLSEGPLLRAQLLQFGPQDFILLLTIHHIVSDGWSIGVITNELGAIYEAFSLGLESPLPDLPIQYADFAVWQKESLEGGQLKSSQTALQLAYWKRKLSDLSPFDVPTDYPRSPRRSFNGNILSRLLPRPLTDSLQEFSARQQGTFFMTSLAALKMLLLHYSDRADIHVGTLLAGRNRVETEPLIGAMINPLVLRTDLAGDPTFVEVLARVRATVLEAIANQDLPFERLVQALNPQRDLNRHPMFDVNFIYQRDFVRPLHFAGITLTALPSRSPGAIYDLNFFMVERADGWRLSCEYNRDLYADATADWMLWQLETLLERIATNPARRISEFRRLIEEKRLDFGANHEQAPRNQAASASAIERPLVAPRDETEAQLAKIWQKLLGGRPVSVKANFFELGGHSLLAARLLAQVRKTLGKKLSLSILFQAPTIEELAAVIRDQNTECKRPVVNAIQPKGSQPPLFWVAGYARFIPLAHCLGDDRPFLGLPLDSLRNLAAPYRMADVAALLVKMIREVQPEGPYFLGGWCIAGVIAYEVAQQLEAQGQQVAFLVLIDAPNPSFSRRLSRLRAYDARLYFLGQKLHYHAKAIRKLGVRGAYSYVFERLRTLRLRYKRKFYKLCYGLHLRAGLPLIAALKDPDEAAILALSDYHPKPWAGRVTLVRNITRLAESYGSRKLGWDELVSKLDVVECPGDHTDMFEGANVAVLAQKLHVCMGNVTPTGPSQSLPAMGGQTSR